MLSKALVILLIFGLVAGIELPGILKGKQWKQLALFSVFFLFALTITVMHQFFKFEFFKISHWLVSVLSYD